MKNHSYPCLTLKAICRLVAFCATILICKPSFAQPSNDNCANAEGITIGSGGFGIGSFTGAQTNVGTATLQSGETFPQAILAAGLSKKSVWYKFTLPTSRSVEVFLKQPAVAIQDGNVGFAVYKTSACLPGDAQISNKLTPIAKFASSKHPCLDAGDYLVQVSANTSANGLIYIALEIAEPDPVAYDKPATAYKFGKLTNKVTAVDFEVKCQSIEAGEVCLPNGSFKNFTKSTWHTFTTPNYFDYLSVLLADTKGNNYNDPQYTVGYRLYEGNGVSVPITSLVQIGGCDSLKTNGYYPAIKNYKCGALKANTTYTIQLLYHKDFEDIMKLAVAWDGSAPTRAPQPVTPFPAGNNLGTLKADADGESNSATDVLACNSRHNNYSCPNTMPVKGVAYNSLNYNLSSFFTFKLATTTSITISATIGYPYNCGNNLILRLYKQTLTGSCTDLSTSNLIGGPGNNTILNCLDPGNYVVQVMGVDSLANRNTYYYGYLATSASPICMYYHLGRDFTLDIRATTQHPANRFALNADGKIDRLNANAQKVMQPLLPGNSYVGATDTFGCANTVLPKDVLCGQDTTKAVFREFVIGENVMAGFTGLNVVYSKLYNGDAEALAKTQNKYSYPGRISGLTPYTNCIYYGTCDYSRNTCLAPGTYTLVNFGSDRQLGQPINSTIDISQPVPKHATFATAQNMGSLWDSATQNNTLTLYSDDDQFTCIDNPATIGGVEPCTISEQKATKLIYRQFYLSEPALVDIRNFYNYYNGCINTGVMTLFSGRVTNGLSGLKPVGAQWSCFSAASTGDACNPLPAGWYTVVSYGYGPSYSKPLQGINNSWQDSWLGSFNKIQISLTKACPGPKFNRPFKASVDTNTLKPYLIEYKRWGTNTNAYPLTGINYTLNREDFNCTVDTPFLPASCGTNMTKVAYYVFKTTQEAYVRIGLGNAALWGSVYAFDIRTKDSTRLNNGKDTALQPCLNAEGRIEICRLSPGTYTLALFAPNTWNCNNTTSFIYIDSVGTSRFDHAAKAYDFGDVLPDSTWYNGKRGDLNPFDKGRAPSNDFFYCTTGAEEKDPFNNFCYPQYNPYIYPDKNNHVLHPFNTGLYGSPYDDRRNLWYTFTVNYPGTVKVRIKGNYGSTEFSQDFTVYQSDEDGKVPFSDLVSSGKVDSTIGQGLLQIASNSNGYNCYNRATEVSFYNEPCTFVPTRYYVLVDNSYNVWVNSQVELEVLLDSVSAIQPKFDHYSQANDMGLVNSGVKKGATDNFSCATKDFTDPLYAYTSCNKTLWYKFTTTTTGYIRYWNFVEANNKFTGRASDYYIQLFQQIIPDDSTNKGLSFLGATNTYYDGNQDQFSYRCISPGTYYIMLTGCGAGSEYTYPQIEILPQAGDFCSVPMVAAIKGPGSKVVPVTVDCHTIGTDYGEFNQTLTCPAGALTKDYKTSWYRLDISGNDKLDLTVYIDEKTNAGSTDIKYRLMTGTCGAMQEQSCVQDALTRNTYECMSPGTSYYIQVFTPVILPNGQPVTGDIELNISAVKHTATCSPATNCIAVAEFTPKFDCTTDRNMSVTNLSTFGSDISYQWDFGYNKQKSNAVSPEFNYPALTSNKIYTIKLVVTNNSCGKKDSITKTITIPARPAVTLPSDTTICTSGASLTLDATSFDGSTYYWYNGTTQPTYTVSYTQKPWVEVTYKNCKARDTIDVWINPVQPRTLQILALCNTLQITLDCYRGQSEQYKWNTGAVERSILTAKPGYYWCDLYLNGCIVRDSFLVVSTDFSILGRDTLICQANMPFAADASVSGASSYRWQDGNGSAIYSIQQPGLYWVDVNFNGCTIRDTLIVAVDSFTTKDTLVHICQGQSFLLPSGRKVAAPGMYSDSLKNQAGCDSIITRVDLVIDTLTRTTISASICEGQFYNMPSGQQVSTAAIHTETLKYQSGCDSLIFTVDLKIGAPVIHDTAATICFGDAFILPSGQQASITGIYPDTVKASLGCDSLITNLTLTVDGLTRIDVNASICSGKTYKLPSGRLVSMENTYTDTLHNIRGCDSLITTTALAVLKPLVESFTAHVCKGAFYTLPSGKKVNITATYTDTAKSVDGCDSLVSTIALIVDIPEIRNISASICAGQFFILPSGKQVNTEKVYQDTLKNINNCDSTIYSIDLKIGAPVIHDTAATICLGDKFMLPSGQQASITGFYSDTVKAALGCDSLVTNLTLKVDSLTKVDVNASICSGKKYTLPSGRIVSVEAVYIDTLRSFRGCDSLITTTKLVVGRPITSSFTAHVCLGKFYELPSGKQVNIAGSYTDTVSTIDGCDSLISTISLLIDNPENRNINAAICAGQFYLLPSGKKVDAEKIYTDTLRNVNGCDSIFFTVDLKIGKPVIHDTAATICLGDKFMLPSGQQAGITGFYSDTVKAALGCDSLVTNLTLKVDSLTKVDVNASICSGKNYTLPSGRIVSVEDIYTDTLRSARGCDSLITTTNLVVGKPLRDEYTAHVCKGAFYILPSGQQVNIEKTYIDTLKNTDGCDSLISTISLLVDKPENRNINAAICAGQFFTLPSGKEVDAEKIYTDTLRNVNGCDSIFFILDLKIGKPVIHDTTATICLGDKFKLPSGKEVSITGFYPDTIKAALGCDSLVTNLTLKVDSLTKLDVNASICSGKNYTLPSGRIVSVEAVYIDTLRSARGCDSLITITNLIVGRPINNSFTTHICFGGFYLLPSGKKVTIANNYTDTVKNTDGCDSLISTISLLIDKPEYRNISASICAGQFYLLPSGKEVNAEKVYQDTLRNSRGCDSLVQTIDLRIKSVIVNDLAVNICSGFSYKLPSGKVVAKANLYRDTVSYAAGCDSLITNVKLTVSEVVTNVKSSFICAGEKYLLPSGKIVTKTGSYKDTLRTSGGCDSIITILELTEENYSLQTLNPSICLNERFISPSRKVFTLSNIYKDTLRNVRGCDSIRFTINLKVLNVITRQVTASICSGQSYSLPGGRLVKIAATYIDSLKTSGGCDSIVTTILSVTPALKITLRAPAFVCEGNAVDLAATVTGGNGGPYTYSWQGANSTGNTASATSLAATKFTVTGSDGCTVVNAADSITIAVIKKPDASITASAVSGCAPFKVSFSNAASGVQYFWNFGTQQAGDTAISKNAAFTYNIPGNYIASLKLTTAEGCSSSSNILITVHETPKASFEAPPVCAQKLVNLQGLVSNPAGISWLWNFNGNTSTAQNPSPSFATPGNYNIQLIVKNTAGCADTVAHTLVVNALPVPGLNNGDVKICLGSNATLIAKDGIAYQWTPAAGLNNAIIANPTASPATDTRYIVTVTNAAGCTSNDSVTVRVTQPFTLVAPIDTFVCIGSSVLLKASGAMHYLWSGPDVSSNATASITVRPATTTTYTITGTGIDDCFKQTSSITVRVIPLPQVSLADDTTVMVGSSFALKPAYSADVNQYRWTPSEYLTCTNCAFPVTTPRGPITYTVTVRNQYQCEASDNTSIRLLCNNESVFVPNTFTPNGDGVNDVWYPRGNGIKTVRFIRVFNRWGQLIFERLNFNTDDRGAGWDGTYKGQLLSPDVFVYSLGMICDNGQAVEVKGNVMIIR